MILDESKIDRDFIVKKGERVRGMKPSTNTKLILYEPQKIFLKHQKENDFYQGLKHIHPKKTKNEYETNQRRIARTVRHKMKRRTRKKNKVMQTRKRKTKQQSGTR